MKEADILQWLLSKYRLIPFKRLDTEKVDEQKKLSYQKEVEDKMKKK